MGILGKIFGGEGGHHDAGVITKRYESSEPNLGDTVKLADGKSFYELFVSENDAGVISPDEERKARQISAELVEQYPDLVKKCAGKSPAEAKTILQFVLPKIIRQVLQ